MIEPIEIKANGKVKKVNTLTSSCVVHMHDLISKYYYLLPDMEPVSPPGIKEENLLESAVSRQTIGFGDYYKYDNCFSNCAALVHSILKNHAFYNGNKRAGLLCMIKHLYSNGYVLKETLEKKEIFELLLAIVDKEPENSKNFVPNGSKKLAYFSKVHLNKFNKEEKKKRITKLTVWETEEQLEFIEYWLKENAVLKEDALEDLKYWDIRIVKKLLSLKNLKIEIAPRDNTVIIYKKRTRFWNGQEYYSKAKMYKLKKTPSIQKLNKKFVEKVLEDFQYVSNDIKNYFSNMSSEEFVTDQIKAYKDLIYELSLT